ncbi:hypothetical protein PSENEW3_00002692 [Picochlorum sp. SENEW3]|nr:hypothetical protein PSENEW3_00002692 [Picochlorum sp. SENEW3]
MQRILVTPIGPSALVVSRQSRTRDRVIAHSRLKKGSKSHHHGHKKQAPMRQERGDELPLEEEAVQVEQQQGQLEEEEEEDYEKTHPHGLAKLVLDIKTALYSWLGTGIEPL